MTIGLEFCKKYKNYENFFVGFPNKIKYLTRCLISAFGITDINDYTFSLPLKVLSFLSNLLISLF